MDNFVWVVWLEEKKKREKKDSESRQREQATKVVK